MATDMADVKVALSSNWPALLRSGCSSGYSRSAHASPAGIAPPGRRTGGTSEAPVSCRRSLGRRK
eukprot:8981627-Pyramimonas_sp.AAC.1